MCQLPIFIFEKCSQFLKVLHIKSFENYYVYGMLRGPIKGIESARIY